MRKSKRVIGILCVLLALTFSIIKVGATTEDIVTTTSNIIGYSGISDEEGNLYVFYYTNAGSRDLQVVYKEGGNWTSKSLIPGGLNVSGYRVIYKHGKFYIGKVSNNASGFPFFTAYRVNKSTLTIEQTREGDLTSVHTLSDIDVSPDGNTLFYFVGAYDDYVSGRMGYVEFSTGNKHISWPYTSHANWPVISAKDNNILEIYYTGGIGGGNKGLVRNTYNKSTGIVSNYEILDTQYYIDWLRIPPTKPRVLLYFKGYESGSGPDSGQFYRNLDTGATHKFAEITYSYHSFINSVMDNQGVVHNLFSYWGDDYPYGRILSSSTALPDQTPYNSAIMVTGGTGNNYKVGVLEYINGTKKIRVTYYDLIRTPIISFNSKTTTSLMYNVNRNNNIDSTDTYHELSTNSGFTQIVKTETNKANSVNLTGLTPNTRYWYRITPKYGTFLAAAYRPASTNTWTSPAVPGAPTYGTVNSSSIVVNWTNGGNPANTTYKLERSPNGSDDWVQIYSSTNLTHTDTGRSADTTYYYRVRTYGNDTTHSAYSSVTSKKTITPPTIPVISSPVAGSYYPLEVPLSASASAPGNPPIYYDWQYSLNGTNWYDIATNQTTTYNWTMPAWAENTVVQVRVRATANGETTTWSGAVSFTKADDPAKAAQSAAQAAADASAQAQVEATAAKLESIQAKEEATAAKTAAETAGTKADAAKASADAVGRVLAGNGIGTWDGTFGSSIPGTYTSSGSIGGGFRASVLFGNRSIIVHPNGGLINDKYITVKSEDMFGQVIIEDSHDLYLEGGKWYRVSAYAKAEERPRGAKINAGTEIIWNVGDLGPGKGWVQKYASFYLGADDGYWLVADEGVGFLDSLNEGSTVGVDYDGFMLEQFDTQPTGPPDHILGLRGAANDAIKAAETAGSKAADAKSAAEAAGSKAAAAKEAAEGALNKLTKIEGIGPWDGTFATAKPGIFTGLAEDIGGGWAVLTSGVNPVTVYATGGLFNNQYVNFGGTGELAWIYNQTLTEENATITNGKWYRVSIWARSEDVRGARAYGIQNANYRDITTFNWGSTELGPTKGWVQKYAIFKAHTNLTLTNGNGPVLLPFNPAGTASPYGIDFDGYFLEEFDFEPSGPPAGILGNITDAARLATEAKEVAIRESEKLKSILNSTSVNPWDGTFDTSTTGVYNTSTSIGGGWYLSRTTGFTGEVVASGGLFGEKYVNLKGPSSTSYFLRADGTAMTLQAGKWYRVSIWARSEDVRGARVNGIGHSTYGDITQMDWDATELGPGKGWVQKYVIFQATDDLTIFTTTGPRLTFYNPTGENTLYGVDFDGYLLEKFDYEPAGPSTITTHLYVNQKISEASRQAGIAAEAKAEEAKTEAIAAKTAAENAGSQAHAAKKAAQDLSTSILLNGNISPWDGTFNTITPGTVTGVSTVMGGGWRTFLTGTQTATIHASGGLYGDQYLTVNTAGSSSYYVRSSSQILSLKVDKWYRISVSARASQTRGARVIGINTLAGATTMTWNVGELGPGKGWVQKHVIFQAPGNYNISETSGPRFLDFNYNGSVGGVDYDGFLIEEFDYEPSGPPGIDSASKDAIKAAQAAGVKADEAKAAAETAVTKITVVETKVDNVETAILDTVNDVNNQLAQKIAVLEAKLNKPSLDIWWNNNKSVTRSSFELLNFLASSSNPGTIQYRYRVDNGNFSSWDNLSVNSVSIYLGAFQELKTIVFEVRDSAQNTENKTIKIWKL